VRVNGLAQVNVQAQDDDEIENGFCWRVVVILVFGMGVNPIENKVNEQQRHQQNIRTQGKDGIFFEEGFGSDIAHIAEKSWIEQASDDQLGAFVVVCFFTQRRYAHDRAPFSWW